MKTIILSVLTAVSVAAGTINPGDVADRLYREADMSGMARLVFWEALEAACDTTPGVVSVVVDSSDTLFLASGKAYNEESFKVLVLSKGFSDTAMTFSTTYSAAAVKEICGVAYLIGDVVEADKLAKELKLDGSLEYKMARHDLENDLRGK